MNRIILIGNGFDVANGLKTSYSDFIIWLWKKLNTKYNNQAFVSKNEYKITGLVTYLPFSKPKLIEPIDIIPQNGVFINEKQTHELCRIIFDNEFLKTITTNFKNKNWVDIEEDYFFELKKCLNGKYKGGIKQLNKDFDNIKEELIEYLNEELKRKNISEFNFKNIQQKFNIADLSSSGINACKDEYFSENKQQFDFYLNLLKSKDNNYESLYTEFYPNNVLFLNFNYTNLPTKIIDNIQTDDIFNYKTGNKSHECIYIHGELQNPQNPIIFGYGDEQDEDHKLIEKQGADYLNNIKTINYLKTGNYKKLLSFIESDYYQVFTFGHSCGLSDKTLLNTLFEHKHCVSIKPFYYEWKDKKEIKHNNYDNIVKNIYRVFSNKTNMRDKVVPKTNCQPLAQNQLHE